MQSVGKKLSVGFTLPLVALGTASVKAFDEQAKSIAQIEAGLKSTEGQVGRTSQQLQQMADDLQSKTLFGDDEILRDATSQLLTFTNIAGTQFDRTQQAALDLATRLDGDLKSASISLGKALNDPVANLSALSRSGIQFSADQKKVINALVATNRLADAQTIILDELARQYGGSAEAAAKAGLGPLQQLGNILGDLLEDFGKIILEGIQPFVDKIKDIALSFKQLSPETKKWIVILGGIAAAIGPLLALAGTILPAIGTGLALLTGPIGLIIAGLTAVGIIIYKNWAPIKKALIDIANYFIDLYNESVVVRVGVQLVINTFKNLFEVGKFVFETLKNIIGGFIENFVNGFKTIGKIIKAVLTGNISELPKIIKEAVNSGKSTFKGFTAELANDWKNLTDGIEQNGKDAIAAITTRNKIAFLKEDVDATGVKDAVAEAVATGISEGSTSGAGGLGAIGKINQDLELFDIQKATDSIKEVEDFLNNTKQKFADAKADADLQIFDSAVSNAIKTDLDSADSAFSDYVSNFNTNAERLQALGQIVPQEFIDYLTVTNSELLKKGAEDFTNFVNDVESKTIDFSSQFGSLVQGGLGDAISTFGDFIGQMVAGSAGIGDLFKGLLGVVADFIGQLGKALVASGLAGIAFKKLFTNPVAAIAAGTALIVLSSVVKNLLIQGPNKEPQGFAHGGVIGGSSFYGDKLLIAANSGELVLNQQQQKTLYNSITPATDAVALTGTIKMKIEGRDLVGVIDTTNVQLSRTR